MTPYDAPPGMPKRVAAYWPCFWASGRANKIPGMLLAAICDVETECGTSRFLDVLGPSGRGDGGHGHGLFQIDDRSHAAWLAKTTPEGLPLWPIPEENTEYAASKVLAPMLAKFDRQWIPALAAFNAGPARVGHALDQLTAPRSMTAVLKAVDPLTANHNYVTRVLTRFRLFGGELPDQGGKLLFVVGGKNNGSPD